MLIIIIIIKQDLIDYLLQLLGPDRQEPIRSFVDNVERFQTGQALVMVVERPSTTADKTPNTTIIPKPDTTTQRATTPSVATVPTIPQRLAAVPPTVSPPVQQLTKATIVPISKPNSVPPKDALIMIKSSNRNKKKAASAVAAALIETRPLQGQASGKPCGCFGTLHKSLTNCLHCGRISCESEGYDYCHYCSFLVQDVEELDRSKYVRVFLFVCLDIWTAPLEPFWFSYSNLRLFRFSWYMCCWYNYYY